MKNQNIDNNRMMVVNNNSLFIVKYQETPRHKKGLAQPPYGNQPQNISAQQPRHKTQPPIKATPKNTGVQRNTGTPPHHHIIVRNNIYLVFNICRNHMMHNTTPPLWCGVEISRRLTTFNFIPP